MRFLLSVLLLCSLVFGLSCTPSVPAKQEQEMAVPCPELAKVLDRIGKLDSLLEMKAEWPAIANVMDAALKGLALNMRQEKEICNYLNLQQYPDQPRFLFADALALRTLQDTLPAGIYYLLRLRGIFSEDAAISEYFSEELARMALQNPACYLGYLLENPDQEVMLLYSTKWNYLDADLLIERFQNLRGAEAVVSYLKNWKTKRSEGGN